MTITIQHVLDRLMEPVQKQKVTVDALKVGDKDALVKGIATTFIATNEVIQQSVDLGVNLLITHEGIYYKHHDKKDRLLNDPVTLEKKRLIEKSNIAIFRFHDYLHAYKPDGIMTGLLHSLSWESNVEKSYYDASILSIPVMSLEEIAEYIKRKLNIPYVRVVGDLSMICERIGILVGYRGGGENTIPLFNQDQLDLIITGEGPEWETPEYVRDAVQQGRKKALIVLGHAESEKPGMLYLANQIQSIYPNVPVHFIDEKPVFQII
ncbi:Nif3-like dinuclear metal center hexameric protein [Lederbergia lenta]|uniref:Nif3-like dinuclear metal center hexameric protein n=1 Tax=Lederbergia lenta TaxID=1467 RepID=UPI00203F3FA7|nr:Nif3-like dinuclear metal center hexameric protein [Lederbergia lenta]MCM3110909.1 Nif3-like dinuclear metal center hexameric protein [Lederbergia lenta]